MIQEHSMCEERPLTITWSASPIPPPRELITQVSGLCFSHESLMLLVAEKEGAWSLPGGHPEPGETIEQTLVREVQEEAGAYVEQIVYLVAQQVDDPSTSSGPIRYYQARFWARVRLDPFHPQFETRYRRLVAPEDFLSLLPWGQTLIAQELFRLASEQDRSFPPHFSL